MVKEKPRHLCAARVGGSVQRRQAALIACHDVGAADDQRLGCRGFASEFRRNQ